MSSRSQPTTQQFTSVVAHPAEDRAMATVGSWKMKSAEALLYHYGKGAAEVDGKLHLRAKAMIVPRIFPVPIVPTPKRGVHYCHLVAPDHLRELVTGDAEPIPAA